MCQTPESILCLNFQSAFTIRPLEVCCVYLSDHGTCCVYLSDHWTCRVYLSNFGTCRVYRPLKVACTSDTLKCHAHFTSESLLRIWLQNCLHMTLTESCISDSWKCHASLSCVADSWNCYLLFRITIWYAMYLGDPVSVVCVLYPKSVVIIQPWKCHASDPKSVVYLSNSWSVLYVWHLKRSLACDPWEC